MKLEVLLCSFTLPNFLTEIADRAMLTRECRVRNSIGVSSNLDNCQQTARVRKSMLSTCTFGVNEQATRDGTRFDDLEVKVKHY